MKLDPRRVEQLREVLKLAEESTDVFQSDQIAFMLGQFPALDTAELVKGFPRLQEQLSTVKPANSTAAAMMHCVGRQDREDNLGRVATILIRALN